MGGPQKTISLSKFIDLLTKHSYMLVSAYCSDANECRFLEVKSPSYQKTFVVLIPEKYKMVADDDTHKRLRIGKIIEPPSRTISYLIDMKGPLLECDVLMISSTSLCVYRHNGSSLCYIIGDGDGHLEVTEGETKKEIENVDPIKQLDSDADKLIEKIDPSLLTKTEDTSTKEEPKEVEVPLNEVEAEGSGETPEDEVMEKVELVFEDGDEAVDENEEVEEKKKHDPSQPMDNSLPSTIEMEEIELGILYVLIDLPTFFRKIEGYEQELITCYDSLDDNEKEVRKQKLKEVNDLLGTATKTLVERLDKISTEELKRRATLVHLTTTLGKLSKLYDKTKTINHASERPEVERVMRQTRSTIHEFNVASLRLRDQADELLTAYSTTLKELIAM